jgi:hypothetical protein
MSRAAARQISFADWELMRQGEQGGRMEPLLQGISDFLDDQEEMIESVRRDLVRGLKKPGSGRSGLTASQILRSLVLMRVKNWDYRELRERIADGLTLRRFTDFYCARVPKHDAFQRGFIRLTPETLAAVNELVVRAAVELGLEDGAKLRVDTTVVQTDIHHPTDNTLLWDMVRVVTRLVRRLAKAPRKYNLRARRIKTAAMSAHMRQSRISFASAKVERATASRSPMPYNFEGCAPRHASMSRRLSRYVICANAMTRNCSLQRRLRTRASPPYRMTIRSKLVHGTNSMSCENSVRPRFTAKPPIRKIGQPTAKTARPTSNRPQIKRASTRCSTMPIQPTLRAQPDSSGTKY